MIFDVGSRQSGKTTRSVEWLKAGRNRILFVCSWAERDRIIHNYNIPVDQVKVWDNHPRLQLRGLPMDTEVMIDNVDLYLQERFGPLAGGSATSE